MGVETKSKEKIEGVFSQKGREFKGKKKRKSKLMKNQKLTSRHGESANHNGEPGRLQRRVGAHSLEAKHVKKSSTRGQARLAKENLAGGSKNWRISVGPDRKDQKERQNPKNSSPEKTK